jgi:hypothetical protein
MIELKIQLVLEKIQQLQTQMDTKYSQNGQISTLTHSYVNPTSRKQENRRRTEEAAGL